MPIALLPDRALVTVTGRCHEPPPGCPDLQCRDIGRGRGAPRRPADPAGQDPVRFPDLAPADGFRLDVASDKAADLAKRLGLYKLRAQVEIAADPTVAVAAAWAGATTAAETATVADSRHPDLARGSTPEGAFSADASEDDYHAHRIGLAVPEGGRDYAYGDAFPHEALMDQLGGVDFRKGCYVGQEVVSRMQHRGNGPHPPPGGGVSPRAPRAGLRDPGRAEGAGADGQRRRIARARPGAPRPAGRRPRGRGDPAGDGKRLAVGRPGYATFAMPDAGGEAAVERGRAAARGADPPP